MKVILLMPRSAMYCHSGILNQSLRYAPLTLTTLAALIPEDLGIEVSILDEGTKNIDVETIQADLVGISAITSTAPRVYAIADQLRKRGIPVVLGGVHPTLLPEEAAQHADSIITGFAEETWPELLRDFVTGKMQSRYQQRPELSLKNLPIPRRDLLNSKKYLTVNTVEATRGCPRKCKFCAVPATWGPTYLMRPVQEVIKEIEQLEGKYFLFLDVNPIENPKYTKQLYRELAPLRKIWGGLSTIRIVEDQELLDLAVKSGCKGLLIGFETVIQESLDQVGKGINEVVNFKKAVDVLHDHGIAIFGCFVLGLEEDDESIFERTVDFVNKACIDLPRFSVYTPYPGTIAFEELSAQGRILTTDWLLYDVEHVVFQPKHMSPERLQEGLHWTWKQAYSLSSIVRRLIGSRNILRYIIPSNIGYRYYAKHLPEFDVETLKEDQCAKRKI